MKKFSVAITAAGLMMLHAGIATAATITNGSFETGNDPGSFQENNSGNPSNIEGWNITGSIDYIGSYWVAADGARSLDLSGNFAGGISQTITGLDIGQSYKISFEMAGNPADPGEKSLSVTLTDPAAFSQVYTFNSTGHSDRVGSTYTDLGWVLYSFIFTATSPSELLSFTSMTHSAYGPALDNIDISATPLPPTFILFGSALGLLGWLNRRKSKGVEMPWMGIPTNA